MNNFRIYISNIYIDKNNYRYEYYLYIGTQIELFIKR